MARTREYDLFFKNQFLKCPEEKAYICDIQGFQRISEDTFILKEISFINLKKTALPTAYLFQPPISWDQLSAEEKCMTQWMEKTNHGIAWDDGDIPYHRLHHILHILSQGVQLIFVNGEQKALWLSNLLPNVTIRNIEEIGCACLKHIKFNARYVCINHNLCVTRQPSCAISNVVSLRAWLLDYLDNKFSEDEVDI